MSAFNSNKGKIISELLLDTPDSIGKLHKRAGYSPDKNVLPEFTLDLKEIE